MLQFIIDHTINIESRDIRFPLVLLCCEKLHIFLLVMKSNSNLFNTMKSFVMVVVITDLIFFPCIFKLNTQNFIQKYFKSQSQIQSKSKIDLRVDLKSEIISLQSNQYVALPERKNNNICIIFLQLNYVFIICILYNSCWHVERTYLI